MVPTLPPGWKSQISVTTQEIYYVNTFTNDRQWSLPMEPAQSSSTACVPTQPNGNINVVAEQSTDDEEEDPFVERRKTAKKKRNSFSHSDNGRLAKLIIQFDKKGVVTSASRDSGTKERKDKVWAQVHKAYNVKNENSPVDLESLKRQFHKIKKLSRDQEDERLERAFTKGCYKTGGGTPPKAPTYGGHNDDDSLSDTSPTKLFRDITNNRGPVATQYDDVQLLDFPDAEAFVASEVRKRQRVDTTPDGGEEAPSVNDVTRDLASRTQNLSKAGKKIKNENKLLINPTFSLQAQREKESESMQKFLEMQSEKGSIEMDMLKVDFETKKVDLAIKKLDFNLKLMQHQKMVQETEERCGKVPDGLIDL